ncbi:MAG: hypothetical protein APR63_04445 [Desulfuromonas sp. SDB]|nr:MAG: hypothetical protein APR63_04445 [Desulfuromonas sp. SDB]
MALGTYLPGGWCSLFNCAGIYILGGLPESATSYLDYCRENARWKDELYQIPSQQQLEDALNQLINSNKWDQPLDSSDIEFLYLQIK